MYSVFRIILLTLILLFSTLVFSIDGDGVILIRTGMISAASSGVVKAQFATAPVLDVEYEKFMTNRKSLVFKTNLGMEAGTGVMRYFSSGVGLRFYFGNIGLNLTENTANTIIEMKPGIRYFSNVGLGFTQMILKSYSNVLSLSSSLLEGCGGGGVGYPLTKKVSLEGQLNICLGYGFSSIAVMTTVTQILMGIGYKY